MNLLCRKVKMFMSKKNHIFHYYEENAIVFIFYVYKAIEFVMFILKIIISRQTEPIEWEKTMKFH